MKYINSIILFSFILNLSSCASPQIKNEDALVTFAKSNCFFWYFKSQNIDTTEIKKITAGVVEMSSYSAEKFQEVAFLVKSYSPNTYTKQNIDIELSKCFSLDSDSEFLGKIEAISKL